MSSTQPPESVCGEALRRLHDGATHTPPEHHWEEVGVLVDMLVRDDDSPGERAALTHMAHALLQRRVAPEQRGSYVELAELAETLHRLRRRRGEHTEVSPEEVGPEAVGPEEVGPDEVVAASRAVEEGRVEEGGGEVRGPRVLRGELRHGASLPAHLSNVVPVGDAHELLRPQGRWLRPEDAPPPAEDATEADSA